MLPLVCRSLSRTLLVRYNSSIAAKPRIRFGSHLLAGVAGGIIGAGYTWYHFSGTTNRILQTRYYLELALDNVSKGKLPTEALWFLRQAVKSCVTFPGSDFVVDKAFDLVDNTVDAHVDEANAIIATAITKIRALIQGDGGKSAKQHTFQILEAVRDLTKQLQPIGLGFKQMGEHYEVDKSLNKGLAMATALRDATMTRISESKEPFGQFRKQIENAVGWKPISDPQPAADPTSSKSDDDTKIN